MICKPIQINNLANVMVPPTGIEPVSLPSIGKDFEGFYHLIYLVSS